MGHQPRRDRPGGLVSCYRCSICALNFPDKAKWKTCAQCGEPTDRLGNATAMDEEEANSLLNHRLFEEFLEKRDAECP